MRVLMMASALSVMGVAAPSAQVPPPATTTAAAPVPPAPFGPPRAFQGYGQPEITTVYCRTVNTGQTTCTLPAMTAGRYLVKATGTSTSTADGAGQKLAVLVGARNCGIAERRPSAQAPWAKGVTKTLRLNCEIVVLSDRPLPITAIYSDDQATKATPGPTLVIERLAWEGVLSATVSATRQDP